MDAHKIVRPEGEAPSQGIRVEKGGDLCGAQAAPLEIEKPQEGVHEDALPAHAAVGNTEGDPAPLAAGKRKDGLDEGGIGLDLGRHDEDVSRGERRVALEQIEDPVLKDLHLPHGTVAGMDLDRVVVNGYGRPDAVCAPVAQVEDIRLDAGKKARLSGPGRKVRFLAARVINHPEEVPAQGPHGGEQAVAPLQMEGFIGAGRPEPIDKFSHLAVGVDEVPVLPAGVHDE